MAKIKKVFKAGWTTVSNDFLKDKELGMKERGLLITMLSLPDNWEFSASGLSAILPNGINGVNSVLKSLEEKNYLQRNKIRNNKGLIVDIEYVFSDSKLSKKPLNNPYHHFSDMDNQDMDNPYMDFEVQLNTNKENTKKENNNKYIVVDKDRFVKAIQKEKERFIEANQTDKYVLEAIDYVINAFNCFGDTNKKYINNFSSEDYIDLFIIAYYILNDDADFANIEKDKAYFSNEIKKRINKQIEMRNVIC